MNFAPITHFDKKSYTSEEMYAFINKYEELIEDEDVENSDHESTLEEGTTEKTKTHNVQSG